jgi:hypothetical protein
MVRTICAPKSKTLRQMPVQRQKSKIRTNTHLADSNISTPPTHAISSNPTTSTSQNVVDKQHFCPKRAFYTQPLPMNCK